MPGAAELPDLAGVTPPPAVSGGFGTIATMAASAGLL
jgi:hypothetical protein